MPLIGRSVVIRDFKAVSFQIRMAHSIFLFFYQKLPFSNKSRKATEETPKKSIKKCDNIVHLRLFVFL